MKKFYFTFGQSHTHSYGGYTFDKDCVVQIEAEDSNAARKIMFDHFNDVWAFEYDKCPDMSYFPRGLVDVNGKTVET